MEVETKETEQQQPVAHGIRTFILIWFGNIISLVGSQITGFALGVWVYQQTGSVLRMGIVFFLEIVPTILVSPLAGAFVDRWNRRWAMILSDSGAGLSTLIVAILFLTNRLEIWHIYLATAASAAFGTFMGPAYFASITLLVPKRHLGRANGMVQLGLAIGEIVAPILGGLLLVTLGLQGVVLIDFATYMFFVITLLFIRIPNVPPMPADKPREKSLVCEIRQGWGYITARHGLLGLLILFTVINFNVGFIGLLLKPLVLSFASPIALGTVLSIGGFGMVLGSAIMIVWGGPKRRISSILIFSLLQGLVLFLGALRPSLTLIAGAAAVFLFSFPIISSCKQVIWQSKVPPHLQGRVFAVESMFSRGAMPLAYLAAGPITDYIFEPLLATDGLLSESIGRLIGTGPGRGVGFLFILIGVLYVIAVVSSFLYSPVRLVDDELGDASVQCATVHSTRGGEG